MMIYLPSRRRTRSLTLPTILGARVLEVVRRGRLRLPPHWVFVLGEGFCAPVSENRRSRKFSHVQLLASCRGQARKAPTPKNPQARAAVGRYQIHQ